MKKLILFDIDGTLISSGLSRKHSNNRFSASIKKVFNVDTIYDRKKYNGATDYRIITSLLQNKINLKTILVNLDVLASDMIENIQKAQETNQIFRLTPGAIELLDSLLSKKIRLGIFTGNLPKVADWKLRVNGIKNYFTFGLFGDKFRTKSEILLNCLPDILNSFNETIKAKDCCIIGDTEEDIKAANKLGIDSLAVLGLSISDRNRVLAEKPSLCVDYLDDKKIINYILNEN